MTTAIDWGYANSKADRHQIGLHYTRLTTFNESTRFWNSGDMSVFMRMGTIPIKLLEVEFKCVDPTIIHSKTYGVKIKDLTTGEESSKTFLINATAATHRAEFERMLRFTVRAMMDRLLAGRARLYENQKGMH